MKSCRIAAGEITIRVEAASCGLGYPFRPTNRSRDLRVCARDDPAEIRRCILVADHAVSRDINSAQHIELTLGGSAKKGICISMPGKLTCNPLIHQCQTAHHRGDHKRT